MDTNPSPGFLRTQIRIRGDEITLLLAMTLVAGTVLGFGIGVLLAGR